MQGGVRFDQSKIKKSLRDAVGLHDLPDLLGHDLAPEVGRGSEATGGIDIFRMASPGVLKVEKMARHRALRTGRFHEGTQG